MSGLLSMVAVVVLLLRHWMAPWAAAACVGAVLVIIGALLLRRARNRLDLGAALSRTRRSLRSDLNVVRRQETPMRNSIHQPLSLLSETPLVDIRDTTFLERRADTLRREIGSTLEELTARTRPKHLRKVAAQQLRQRSAGLALSVLRSILRRPGTVVAIGLAISAACGVALRHRRGG